MQQQSSAERFQKKVVILIGKRKLFRTSKILFVLEIQIITIMVSQSVLFEASAFLLQLSPAGSLQTHSKKVSKSVKFYHEDESKDINDNW